MCVGVFQGIAVAFQTDLSKNAIVRPGIPLGPDQLAGDDPISASVFWQQRQVRPCRKYYPIIYVTKLDFNQNIRKFHSLIQPVIGLAAPSAVIFP